MRRIKRGWQEDFEYHGRLSKRQARKREALIRDGLDAKIAHQFVFFDFKLAYMRRFRAILQRGITANPWATFRRVYEEAIIKWKKDKRGGYKPPVRPYDSSKPHKTKEQAKEQAKRAKERAKEEGMYAYAGEGKPREFVGKTVQDKKTGQFYTKRDER